MSHFDYTFCSNWYEEASTPNLGQKLASLDGDDTTTFSHDFYMYFKAVSKCLISAIFCTRLSVQIVSGKFICYGAKKTQQKCNRKRRQNCGQNDVKKATYDPRQIVPNFWPGFGVDRSSYQMGQNLSESSPLCKANSFEIENGLNFRSQFSKRQTRL